MTAYSLHSACLRFANWIILCWLTALNYFIIAFFVVLDADGKPGSGVYEGNLLWLGSYQECQATPDSHYCLSQLNVSPKIVSKLFFSYKFYAVCMGLAHIPCQRA